MLDLIHLGRRRWFPAGGEDLYRRVALLTGMGPGVEVLDVGCGTGVVLEFLVREHGAQGAGVDADPYLVSRAEEYFKDAGLASEVTFQEASPANLPFRGETFDVAIGEVGLAASVGPKDAIAELVRVVRPGGRVVLSQLVWKGAVEDRRKETLTQHLGARPLMTVELRRILTEAGLRDLHIEDWTEEGRGFRSRGRKPFPDFTELFTLGERLGILRRAWKRWGWRGAGNVFQRELEVHHLLTKERVLGLSLLIGVKPLSSDAQGLEEAGVGASGGRGGGDRPLRQNPVNGQEQTLGLPLFGAGEGSGSGA